MHVTYNAMAIDAFGVTVVIAIEASLLQQLFLALATLKEISTLKPVHVAHQLHNPKYSDSHRKSHAFSDSTLNTGRAVYGTNGVVW